jgi:pilus assembly protein Flp/PilA
MDRLLPLLRAFLRGDRGATAIEYGFIAALISIAAAAALRLIGGSVQEMFSSINPGLM